MWGKNPKISELIREIQLQQQIQAQTQAQQQSNNNFSQQNNSGSTQNNSCNQAQQENSESQQDKIPLEIDLDELNYIQQCYTTREDNILHLRIYLMQLIENMSNQVITKTSTNAFSNQFQGYQNNGVNIGNEIRQIVIALQTLEKWRIQYEDVIIAKYYPYMFSRSTGIGQNQSSFGNVGIKALGFKIFSKIHKLNIAYLNKIQMFYPKLYEIIYGEQLQMNNSIKENSSNLLSSSSLNLGKIFGLVAKSGRMRLTKEMARLQNIQSYYLTIGQERNKNKQNERFYSDKHFQGFESFSYIIGLQKKYLLKHQQQTNNKNILLLNRKQCQQNLYDDLLNIDRKKINQDPQQQPPSLITLPVIVREHESILETILCNYDKYTKEWMQNNKYINQKIKYYSQAVAKCRPFNSKNVHFPLVKQLPHLKESDKNAHLSDRNNSKTDRLPEDRTFPLQERHAVSQVNSVSDLNQQKFPLVKASNFEGNNIDECTPSLDYISQGNETSLHHSARKLVLSTLNQQKNGQPESIYPHPNHNGSSKSQRQNSSRNSSISASCSNNQNNQNTNRQNDNNRKTFIDKNGYPSFTELEQNDALIENSNFPINHPKQNHIYSPRSVLPTETEESNQNKLIENSESKLIQEQQPISRRPYLRREIEESKSRRGSIDSKNENSLKFPEISSNRQTGSNFQVKTDSKDNKGQFCQNDLSSFEEQNHKVQSQKEGKEESKMNYKKQIENHQLSMLLQQWQNQQHSQPPKQQQPQSQQQSQQSSTQNHPRKSKQQSNIEEIQKMQKILQIQMTTPQSNYNQNTNKVSGTCIQFPIFQKHQEQQQSKSSMLGSNMKRQQYSPQEEATALTQPPTMLASFGPRACQNRQSLFQIDSVQSLQQQMEALPNAQNGQQQSQSQQASQNLLTSFQAQEESAGQFLQPPISGVNASQMKLNNRFSRASQLLIQSQQFTNMVQANIISQQNFHQQQNYPNNNLQTVSGSPQFLTSTSFPNNQGAAFFQSTNNISTSFAGNSLQSFSYKKSNLGSQQTSQNAQVLPQVQFQQQQQMIPNQLNTFSTSQNNFQYYQQQNNAVTGNNNFTSCNLNTGGGNKDQNKIITKDDILNPQQKININAMNSKQIQQEITFKKLRNSLSNSTTCKYTLDNPIFKQVIQQTEQQVATAMNNQQQIFQGNNLSNYNQGTFCNLNGGNIITNSYSNIHNNYSLSTAKKNANSLAHYTNGNEEQSFKTKLTVAQGSNKIPPTNLNTPLNGSTIVADVQKIIEENNALSSIDNGMNKNNKNQFNQQSNIASIGNQFQSAKIEGKQIPLENSLQSSADKSNIIKSFMISPPRKLVQMKSQRRDTEKQGLQQDSSSFLTEQ